MGHISDGSMGHGSIPMTHCLLWSTVPIANFLPVLSNQVTVYIIFFLPKPLHTALIVPGKDNIFTNSLTSNSHSTTTVLSIDIYLNSDDWLVFISSLFFASPCVFTVFCCFWCFLFYFLRSCNSVRMSRLLDLTRLVVCRLCPRLSAILVATGAWSF